MATRQQSITWDAWVVIQHALETAPDRYMDKDLAIYLTTQLERYGFKIARMSATEQKRYVQKITKNGRTLWHEPTLKYGEGIPSIEHDIEPIREQQS